MGYRAVGIYGWLLLSANGCSSINAHTSLAVLDIECLLWLHLSLMSVCYALHWIAFNSFVERWTILTLISNECGGVIDFNGLLPVGLSVTLFPIWHVNLYSCHLWGTHLMYVVVIHHMDDASLINDAGLMDDVTFDGQCCFFLLLLYDGWGLFFSSSIIIVK